MFEYGYCHRIGWKGVEWEGAKGNVILAEAVRRGRATRGCCSGRGIYKPLNGIGRGLGKGEQVGGGKSTRIKG